MVTFNSRCEFPSETFYHSSGQKACMAVFEILRILVKMCVIKLIILARSFLSGYLEIAFAPIILSSDWLVEFTNKMKT